MVRRRVAAFTLLEMSIVLIIMAAMLSGGISTFLAYVKKEGYENTENRMKEIEHALVTYRNVFNRLPCPADITRAMDTTEFGREANNKGSCTGGTIAANFTSSKMISGGVPVRDLGLDDDYAFDSWGRRIRYNVDKRYTENEAFNVYDDEPVMPSAFNLISHGANGHGGYPRGGGSTMFNAGSTNTKELKNCNCTNTAAAGTFDGTFEYGTLAESSSTATDNFDDIVSFTPPRMLGIASNVEAPPFICSDEPIGTICPDGTVYAGLSPDGNVPMYTTRCDLGQTWDGSSCSGSRTRHSWNDGAANYIDTSIPNGTAGANGNQGKSNTLTLVSSDSSTLPGQQPHMAAEACNDSNEHTRDDWYLPAANELMVLYNNKTLIGNFESGTVLYFTSNESNLSNAFTVRFNAGLAVALKYQTKNIRCIRR